MQTPVINNRAARHNYQVLDTYEVGIMLRGTEVKSIREGKLILSEAFAIVRNNELFLANAHVEEYSRGNIFNHLPSRERKLLAHKSEIIKMHNATAMDGLTLIPLKAYFKGSVLKIELGVCRGKANYDKRQAKIKQEANREMARALRAANR